MKALNFFFKYVLVMILLIFIFVEGLYISITLVNQPSDFLVVLGITLWCATFVGTGSFLFYWFVRPFVNFLMDGDL
jgi:hypothetical protein